MKTTAAPLKSAALAGLASGLVLVVVAGLLAGGSAAAGAAAGAGIALGVFAFGAFAVDMVARLMPSAALLFAMLTYAFQVVLMALVFVALERSGALEESLDRSWLGGTIIAATFVWLAVQVWRSMTARIPAFESVDPTPSDASGPATAPGVRPTAEVDAR